LLLEVVFDVPSMLRDVALLSVDELLELLLLDIDESVVELLLGSIVLPLSVVDGDVCALLVDGVVLLSEDGVCA